MGISRPIRLPHKNGGEMHLLKRVGPGAISALIAFFLVVVQRSFETSEMMTWLIWAGVLVSGLIACGYVLSFIPFKRLAMIRRSGNRPKSEYITISPDTLMLKGHERGVSVVLDVKVKSIFPNPIEVRRIAGRVCGMLGDNLNRKVRFASRDEEVFTLQGIAKGQWPSERTVHLDCQETELFPKETATQDIYIEGELRVETDKGAWTTFIEGSARVDVY